MISVDLEVYLSSLSDQNIDVSQVFEYLEALTSSASKQSRED